MDKLEKLVILSKEKIEQIQKLQEEILAINNEEEFNQIELPVLNESIFTVKDIDSHKINEGIAVFEEQNKKYDLEVKLLTKKCDQLKQSQLLKQLDDLVIEKIGETNFLTHIFDNISAKDLTQIANKLKSQHQNSTITLLFAKSSDKVSALIQISQDLLANYDASALIKTIVGNIGAKGAGGKKDFAMTGGSNPGGINDAIETIKKLLKT